jgi:iron(III) transport system substrate-binding protein
MSRISRRVALALALLALIVAALAGAGTSASAPAATAKTPPPNPIKGLVKSLKGMSLSAREAKLLSLAKQEGQVNVYTSLSSLVLKPLQAAWAKQYPDVKLNVYRASSEDVTARILAERNAGTSGADVVETNGTNMLIFQGHFKDILVPYRQSPYSKGVPKIYRFDAFTADRIEKFVVAWNTNLVPAGQEPKSFSDLANPKWKGKLAMEPTDTDWFATLYTYMLHHGGPKGKPMKKAKLNALWRAIAANSQFINGHTTEANLLAAGQIQVIVSGHAQSLEQLQAKKAPISFTPFVKPVIERPQGIGIVYRLQHQAAALLFYDWMLSSTGQKLLQANGVEPANPRFPDNAFLSNPKTIRVDLRPVVRHYGAWQKFYSSFTHVGGGRG